jgi:hypothetical protein
MEISDWLRAWRARIDANPDLVPGPQLLDGLQGWNVPPGGGFDPNNRGTEVGRTFVVHNAGWTERYVVDSPQTLRQTSPLDCWKLALPSGSGNRNWLSSSDKLDHTLPGGSGWQAMSTFTYTPLSEVEPPSDPPSPPYKQQYDVKTWANGSTTTTGALYRMGTTYALPGGGTAEWWWDHWVLYGSYQSPALSPVVAMRLVTASTASSLTAFLQAQKAAHDSDPDAKYAVVELKWEPI